MKNLAAATSCLAPASATPLFSQPTNWRDVSEQELKLKAVNYPFFIRFRTFIGRPAAGFVDFVYCMSTAFDSLHCPESSRPTALLHWHITLYHSSAEHTGMQ
ncbi:MAG: hypothetical protein J0I80_03250 [Sphingomonas sp.]|nr:hypothetical protein [Sphingomonas sp.]